GVLGDKSKKIEIALRVADDAFEIVDLKQAQVPMIILNAFLLQLRALFSRKLVSLAFLLDASGPLLMIFQKRFAIVGTAAIRPAAQFHLQHAEIDSQLQFFAAIEAGDLAHFDAAALVRPISQDAIEIQTHVAKHPAFNLRLSITSRRQPSEFGRRHACRYNIRSWKIRSTLLSGYWQARGSLSATRPRHWRYRASSVISRKRSTNCKWSNSSKRSIRKLSTACAIAR